MKELIDKISSYNLFNYWLPGVLFAYISTKMGYVNLIQEDLIAGAFIYYFIGLVISRFGSLFIEPILKKILFLKFSDYKEFVAASKNDNKIEILLESNNMYRTFVSMFAFIGMLKTYKYFESKWVELTNYSWMIIILLLIILFIFAYRKQTNYIVKRVKSNKE